ncbi:MAG: DUF488 family protein [Acidobacteriia bacterium]|nr:DUF488 family protein [Terriglobia bacterium]
MVKMKRVYESPSRDDGYRVLVDRLWPRGLTREKAHIDEWLRNIAPSNTLRQWYQHDPNKWTEFQKRYARELKTPAAAECLTRLKQLARQKTILTLVFGSKEEKLNNAAALMRFLKAR